MRSIISRSWNFLLISSFVACCLICSSIAGWNFVLSIYFGDITAVGQALERGDSMNADAIDYINDKSAELLDHRTCRSDLILPAMTVYLNLLSGSGAQTSFVFSPAILRGFVFALQCNRRDGNLVLREGMLNFAISGDAKEMASSLVRSQQLAPAEWSVMLARLGVWNILPSALQQEHRDTIDRDRKYVCVSEDEIAARYGYRPTGQEKKLLKACPATQTDPPRLQSD